MNYRRLSATHECFGCGVTFHPRHKEQSFCTRQCWRLHGTSQCRQTVQCKVCNNLFITYKTSQSHCSITCLTFARKKAEEKSKSDRAKKCCWCGVIFITEQAKPKQRFCSRQCSGLSRLICYEFKCANCNKVVKRPTSRRRCEIEYCSLDCHNASRVYSNHSGARQFIQASGWPGICRLSCIKVLNCLAAIGIPATASELAKITESGSITNVLGMLVRLEMVVVIPNWQKSSGPRFRSGYTLSPYALSILEERAKCESGK